MLVPVFVCATGPPHSSAEAPGEPASCVSMAMEQDLQGVPGTQGCQAMLLIGSWTASYWPSLLEANVPVLGVFRRESVAMAVFTALFAVFISYRQASALALRFSPTKHIPQPGIQLLKWDGRHDVNKMGLVKLLGRWQCFKAAAVPESPCPEFFVFTTANPASAQPQEFPL